MISLDLAVQFALIAAVPDRSDRVHDETRRQIETGRELRVACVTSAELGARVSEPAFYKGEAAEQARVHARLAALPAELAAAYARWEELEAIA